MKTSQQSTDCKEHPSRPRWRRVATCCGQRVGHIRRNNHVVLSLGAFQTIHFIARSSQQVHSRRGPNAYSVACDSCITSEPKVHDPQSVSLLAPTSFRTITGTGDISRGGPRDHVSVHARSHRDASLRSDIAGLTRNSTEVVHKSTARWDAVVIRTTHRLSHLFRL